MKTVVTGVVGLDAHIVGNKILQKAMEDIGLKVVGLGALTPAEQFIKVAVETNADAIVISSLYGHAEMDCQGFRDKCLEAGLKDIRLYIGGMLTVGDCDFGEVERRFKALGFDRVYPPTVKIQDFLNELKADLGVD